MLWKDAKREPPTKPGQYFCWHPLYGRWVIGWNDGWGQAGTGGVPRDTPDYWIDNDQCPPQAQFGSAERP
jgi:hypothetical protein